MWLTILSDQLPVKSLGGPLPRQLADRTRTHLKALGLAVPSFDHQSMPTNDHIGNYHRFRDAMPDFKESCSRVPHPFAAIPCGIARLACLIHAASVHSEPGSNSPKYLAISGYLLLKETGKTIRCQRSIESQKKFMMGF